MCLLVLEVENRKEKENRNPIGNPNPTQQLKPVRPTLSLTAQPPASPTPCAAQLALSPGPLPTPAPFFPALGPLAPARRSVPLTARPHQSSPSPRPRSRNGRAASSRNPRPAAPRPNPSRSALPLLGAEHLAAVTTPTRRTLAPTRPRSCFALTPGSFPRPQSRL